MIGDFNWKFYFYSVTSISNENEVARKCYLRIESIKKKRIRRRIREHDSDTSSSSDSMDPGRVF